MKQLKTSNWTVVALVVAVVILALAGIGLLGGYFLSSRQATADTGWVNPIGAVDGSAVAPDLAVLTLAGESDERVTRAALDANEIATAYATLAFSTLLSDQLRSGQWLLLGSNTRERDPNRSLIAYQAALDEAALGPALSDLARADISVQAARGFTALEKTELARLATAQAENIARYSLTLLPAQRRSILQQVASTYTSLGETASAQAVRDNMETYTAGPGVSAPRTEPLLPTLRGAVILPAEVAAAMSARQQAAAALAGRWLSASPGDRDALVQALGEALILEDEARTGWYSTGADLALADRITLLHDRITWLAIKYRAARLGYGASLVPEWEAQGGQIEVELANAYTELINSYGQQLDTMDAVEKLQANVELLREGVLLARLGLFSAGAEDDLRADLIDASRQLWTRQGGSGLTVVAQDLNGRLLYLLTGAAPQ